MSDVTQWLTEGITAVKDGRREEARRLLMQVVAVNEENETAWLWLSSVVDEESDRRLCLQNVLSLNPDHATARRTLIELDKAAGSNMPAETAVTFSDVSAIRVSPIQFQQQETFDDVWSRNVSLCAYCAAQVEPEQSRCPHCQRNLLVWLYRYADPSNNLVLFWISLVVVGITFSIQAGYGAVTLQSPLATLSGLLMTLILLGTAVALYFRYFWAFVLALVCLVLIILNALFQLFIGPDLSRVAFDRLDPAIRGVVQPLTSGTWLVIKGFQLGMALFSLVFAFRAWPDFDRMQYRQIAAVSKGLRHASEYHAAAQRLAQAGLWGTAVLHWQRAAALEITHLSYQRHLGTAYARLGFYERSLDVLQAARRRATHPDTQTEFDAAIQAIQQQAPPQPTRSQAAGYTHPTHG